MTEFLDGLDTVYDPEPDQPYHGSMVRLPGQFYVRDVGTSQRDVPIDNFIYICENGDEFKLEFVGDDRIVVSYHNEARDDDRFEWFESVRHAMIRMAALIEGTLTWENFGV